MRSAGKMFFEFICLSIHIGKWVLGIYAGVTMYRSAPGAFWAFVFLFLGLYILRDLSKVFKAIIKDTTLDALDTEGEQSYLKGINPDVLRAVKAQIFVYLVVSTIGVVGISNNVSRWKEDGQNRVGNIVVMSLFAAAPVAALIGQARKRD